MPEISRYAVVEKGAQLADDVRVGPFAYVGPKVTIGPGCIIENNVSITGKTELGPKNHVFPMAVIGAPDPQAPSAVGQVVLGEANDIREQVTIYAGQGEPTRIGHDNLIMIGCQVGPSAQVGDHGIFANCTHINAKAIIEDYVRTSAFPVIESSVRVGAYTFVAGYACIDRDAPPFAIVQGFPYRVRGVNTHNLQRCGFTDEDISRLKRIFRELFDGSGSAPDPEVLQRLTAARESNVHVRRLLESLRAAGSAT